MPISLQHCLTVIPARYASTRFPAKPLALLKGKPMILHTIDRVMESDLSQSMVVVATDDERIAEVVRSAGHTALMTQSTHETGSDRAWEVATHYPEASWVINVQGDEPFLPASHLNTLLAHMNDKHDRADILTLACPLQSLASSTGDLLGMYTNPNCVKALVNQQGQALYFSRATVPFVREGLSEALLAQQQLPLYRHIGLYAYQRHALKAFVQAAPSALEQLEKLEQLSALELGLRIDVGLVDSLPHGVDTPEDLAILEQSLALS
jgi:3-deoxy-manno-octulosonate cytidylyltransferase (CMP-KDO synthetase)